MAMQINNKPFTGTLSSLPSEEIAGERLVILNQALKDLIRECGKIGLTYKDFQDICGVEENAIKQFMFRQSRKPRFTNVVRKLSAGILDLASNGKLEKSAAISIVASFAKTKLRTCNIALRHQFESFYHFFSRGNQYSLLDGATAPLFDQGKDPRNDIKFFCYKKSKSHGNMIEKSEYYFFRDSDLSEDECCFTEVFPERSGGILERHGLVRLSDNLITLFYFYAGGMTATHLRCLPEKKRAYGVTVFGGDNGLSIELAVFVPESKVSNKDLGFFDSVSNSAAEELTDFTEGFYELRRSI
jgi:hypothetical protein